MCSKTQKARRSPSIDHPCAHPALAQRDQLARLHLAQQARTDDVERAGLRGDAEAAVELAQSERPQAVGIAEGDDAVAGQDDGRERAVQARHDVGDGVLDALRRVGGEQRGDDLRVRGRAEADPALDQLGVQLDRVDQVAVVGEGDLAAVRAPDGLRVLPAAGAGGRVADVPDRHVTRQGEELLLVEDLAHQAQVAQGHDVAVARAGDARGLLAAVLERVEREVGQPRNVVLGRVYPEDPALVARAVAAV